MLYHAITPFAEFKAHEAFQTTTNLRRELLFLFCATKIPELNQAKPERFGMQFHKQIPLLGSVLNVCGFIYYYQRGCFFHGWLFISFIMQLRDLFRYGT